MAQKFSENYTICSLIAIYILKNTKQFQEIGLIVEEIGFIRGEIPIPNSVS